MMLAGLLQSLSCNPSFLQCIAEEFCHPMGIKESESNSFRWFQDADKFEAEQALDTHRAAYYSDRSERFAASPKEV